MSDWRWRRGKAMLDVIPPDWQPSDAVVQLLGQNGVSREFALALVLEFRIYWAERGVKHHAWGSKFAKHCMFEWRRYEIMVARGETIQAMTSSWRPSEATMRAIANAGIDVGFAEAVLLEFIIYWCDRGDICNTWNTKFIGHVRYKWQNRQLFRPGIQATRNHDMLRDLTDRSWAQEYLRGGDEDQN